MFESQLATFLLLRHTLMNIASENSEEPVDFIVIHYHFGVA